MKKLSRKNNLAANTLEGYMQRIACGCPCAKCICHCLYNPAATLGENFRVSGSNTIYTSTYKG